MNKAFIYRNPIFISEVKKRLADKRNYKLKTRLIMIDKLPMEKEESQKNSLLISNNNSQSNLKHFMNFIKEKGYKSAFAKISNSTQTKLNKNISFNKKREKIKYRVPNIIKLFNAKNKDFFYKINIRRHDFNNQRQTPFQINHIKNNYLKQYIKFSKKKNIHNYIENEKSIKSYSINKSGQKMQIFGDNKNIIKHLSGNKTVKINSISKKYRTCFISRAPTLKNYFNTVKPNCYYNRLNLRNYCLKPKQNKENIEKKEEE